MEGCDILDKTEERKPKVVKADQEVVVLEQPPPQPPYYELVDSWPPRRQRLILTPKVVIVVAIAALIIGFFSFMSLYGGEVIPGFIGETTTTAISTVTTTKTITATSTSNLLNWSAVLYVYWRGQIPYDGEITIHDAEMNRTSTIMVSHGVAIYSNITKDVKRIRVYVKEEEGEIDLTYGKNWIYTITLRTNKKAYVKIVAYDRDTYQMLDKFTLKVNGTESIEFRDWRSEEELTLTIPGDYTIIISKEGYEEFRINLKGLKSDIAISVPLSRKNICSEL